jgi:hypothetical protein
MNTKTTNIKQTHAHVWVVTENNVEKGMVLESSAGWFRVLRPNGDALPERFNTKVEALCKLMDEGGKK